MEKREFIGIDVSKPTLDAWLFKAEKHKQFKNNKKGFQELLKWVEQSTLLDIKDTAFCFEHTGLYSLALSLYLTQKQLSYYFVSGLLVKRSLGLKRGKNDKIDAQCLSRFAWLHREELKPYQMPSQTIIKLKELHSFRAKMVRQCSSYKADVREMKTVEGADSSETIVKLSKELIKVFAEKIKAIEKQMLQLIKTDESLLKTYQNITSIKGVGMILSIAVLVSTNNFKLFDDTRKFACFCGIAPFEHQSGISYRGKSRISSLGNRKLKTLLSQAAASAIQHNPEMKQYYQKRLAEGKNKMSTLNIIRNKIVGRIFAVAKRQTPYVDLFKYAA